MNYFDLTNLCLQELNYTQASAFSELVKKDHKKILNILNIVNREICSLEGWDFLLRKTSLTLPKNTSQVDNPVSGRIRYVLIDGVKYNFVEDFGLFISGKNTPNTYSLFNDKLLFPKFNQDKTAEIIYYTNNCVIDVNGDEKESFEFAQDETLIPMPFAQQLLVYGTCLRVKANPEHVRFPYWMSMYKEALANLKSKSNSIYSQAPVVKLFRK